MNIYEKLIAVRKTVPYLKKDKEGYQFSYVSSSQTLGALREGMDKYGLLLIPRVKEKTTGERTTAKGNKELFTELVMSFTWINAEKPQEQIECTWYGQGLDTGEKGVGKATTYALKYFLLQQFFIATDKDDPDRFQEKVNNSNFTKKKNGNSSGKKATSTRRNNTNGSIKKIRSLMKDKRLTKTEVKLIDDELKKKPSEERAQQIIDRINELVSGRIPEKGGSDHAEKEEQHKEKVLV